MNLLSIGAAYGVLVAVFQWGWGKNLIGVGKAGPIESFLPMMLFAILFGLSMDYEVFLLSRIKEEYDTQRATTTARPSPTAWRSPPGSSRRPRRSWSASSPASCSATSGSSRSSASAWRSPCWSTPRVVRMILVPAAMELLGDANWWFPSWLAWLPKVHIEGTELRPRPRRRPRPTSCGPPPGATRSFNPNRSGNTLAP